MVTPKPHSEPLVVVREFVETAIRPNVGGRLLALQALDNLEEQKEASDKAAASMSADVTRFGRALQRIADAVEAWDNDETPDEDFLFDADMDFVNFCGHVARAALASNPAKEHS